MAEHRAWGERTAGIDGPRSSPALSRRHPPSSSSPSPIIAVPPHRGAALAAVTKAVQTILGHASATMTMDLYGHRFSDARWREMDLMPEVADHLLTISADEDRSLGEAPAS